MKTLLFPGWASFESFYKKELKEDFFYMEQEYLETDKVNVIAWSMGTLRALEFAKTHKINKLILMAPTMDFTETTDKALINQMINGLKINKEITLKNFYKMNFNSLGLFKEFMNEYENEIKKLSIDELINGLEFLRDTKIHDLNLKNVDDVYIFYGTEDKIISINERFLDFSKTKEFLMGHNFIYKNSQLKELVRSILND